MDEALFVGVVQTSGSLPNHVAGLPPRQGAFPDRQQFLQIDPLDEFQHHVVNDPIDVLAGLQGFGPQDIRVAESQTRLGLKDSEGAPATLRRFFGELEEEGFITKQGQKRGTRYVWKGIVQNSAPALPPVKLVKRSEDEEE